MVGECLPVQGSGQVETALSSLAPVPRVRKRSGAVCLKGVREPIKSPGQRCGPWDKKVEKGMLRWKRSPTMSKKMESRNQCYLK